MNCGPYVRKLRKQHSRYKVHEMAAICGLSRGYYSSFERTKVLVYRMARHIDLLALGTFEQIEQSFTDKRNVL